MKNTEAFADQITWHNGLTEHLIQVKPTEREQISKDATEANVQSLKNHICVTICIQEQLIIQINMPT